MTTTTETFRIPHRCWSSLVREARSEQDHVINKQQKPNLDKREHSDHSAQLAI